MPILKHYKAVRVIENRIEQLNKEIIMAQRIIDNPEMEADVYFAKHDIKNISQEVKELRETIEFLIKPN